MALSPSLRKGALLVHVTTSIGWFGTVAVFLSLAVTGATSSDPGLARACYAVMGIVGWAVIVPASLASLVSGVISSLGTPWGLFRYYWVTIKLAITVIATAVLLVHMQPITHLADLAAHSGWDPLTAGGLRSQLVLQAALALAALVTTTALSVFKPQGRTRYGLRRLEAQRTS